MIIVLSSGGHCRLIRGGDWIPTREGALTENSVIVEAVKSIGLEWGGKIPGKQKDFLHFSPTGY